MIRNIKKSNLILGLLVIAFFAVSLSFVLDIQTPSPTIPTQPTIVEIEESHSFDTPITHGGLPSGCDDCHTQPVDMECTECHTPDYWVGDKDLTYFPHHSLDYSGFNNCWSNSCHAPNLNDVRYVNMDLVKDGNWMGFCDNCHASGMTHNWPKP